jgi:predicted AlkP superfamily pyrophosphatase or phosphodiesterase
MEAPNPPRLSASLCAASFVLFAVLMPCASAVPAPAVPAAPAATAGHVILISCDGLRPDVVGVLGKERLPSLHRLVREGASTKRARADVTHTVTLPNHTCMITGRGVAGGSGHTWTDNVSPRLGEMLHRNKGAYLASMFDVAHDHGMRTALYTSKTKFVLYDRSYDERNGREDKVGVDDGKDKIDDFVFIEDTDALVARFLAAMAKQPYQLSMLHLRDPDTAGHASGWDLTEGSPYLVAVEHVDRLVGRLLAAIDADDYLRGKISIILTADHGGQLETKTHVDPKDPRNFTIPFMVWGAGVEGGVDLYEINQPNRKDPGTTNPHYEAEGPPAIRNGDAGNLALKLLGLPPIEGSTINAAQDLRVAR